LFTDDYGKDPVLIVGAAVNLQTNHFAAAPACEQSLLISFRFVASEPLGPLPPSVLAAEQNGAQMGTTKLETIHHTVIRDAFIPSAVHVASPVGALFVGFANRESRAGVHMYTWGMRQLLWKHRLCFPQHLQSPIVAIDSIVDRTSDVEAVLSGRQHASTLASGSSIAKPSLESLLLLVATQDYSVFIAKIFYLAPAHEMLCVVASDAIPRLLSAAIFLDDRTIAVADRFGTIAILRIPQDARLTLPFARGAHNSAIQSALSEDADDGELSVAEKLQELSDALEFRQARNFLKTTNSFCVGEAVNTLQCCRIQHDGVEAASNVTADVLVYGTVLGTVGCLIPFIDEYDAVVAAHLMPLIHRHFATPSRRDLSSWRGLMCPAKAVIDGDLVELLRTKELLINELCTAIEHEERLRVKFLERNPRGFAPLLSSKDSGAHLITELAAKMRALVSLSV
jgi:splicing factor 3B subunit 3